MATTRITDLAKKWHMTSDEVFNHFIGLKFPVASKTGSVDNVYVGMAEKSLSAEIAAAQAKQKAQAKTDANKEDAKAKAAKAKADAHKAAALAELASRQAAQEQATAVTSATVLANDTSVIPAADASSVIPAPAGIQESTESSTESTENKAAKSKASAKLDQADQAKQAKTDLQADKAKTSQTRGLETLEQQIAAQAARVAQQQAKPEKQTHKGKTATKAASPAPPTADAKLVLSPELQRMAAGKAVLEGRPFAVESQDRYSRMAQAVESFEQKKELADVAAKVASQTPTGTGARKKRKEKREEARALELLETAEKRGIDADALMDESVIKVTSGSTLGQFAESLGVSQNEIIKRLFTLGTTLTVNQVISDDLIELIADDMGKQIRLATIEEEYVELDHDDEADLQPRAPVVTVMGHVDHGKTSLLDVIRATGVVATEAGGITQHIGAYSVQKNGRLVTFIDTPGHEAFTAMRARGATLTDVVVLVVAADDGVMPQTIESIDHAKAAGVPLVVAINKIDKDNANVEKVKSELSEHGVIGEDWGGTTIFQEISAKQNLNIDKLLELLLLQADILELKANPNALASGHVLEAKLEKGRGPVITALVQRGTLRQGDAIVAGPAFGRVRAMSDYTGAPLAEAGPSIPVEILGLSTLPAAGDDFRVFADERDARNLADKREQQNRLTALSASSAHTSLEDLFERIQSGHADLNLVVKADVQGSIEALADALGKMDQTEVSLNFIHSSVGAITESDVTLAAASDAVIIGFNVRPTVQAKALAQGEKVELKLYRVIYQALEDIEKARVGLLKPEEVEVETALLEVKEVYKVPAGMAAGCSVETGELAASDQLRVVRDGTVVYDGTIAEIRHYKEVVKTIKAGSECGVTLVDFADIKVGDILEGYRIDEVAREK